MYVVFLTLGAWDFMNDHNMFAVIIAVVSCILPYILYFMQSRVAEDRKQFRSDIWAATS